MKDNGLESKQAKKLQYMGVGENLFFAIFRQRSSHIALLWQWRLRAPYASAKSRRLSFLCALPLLITGLRIVHIIRSLALSPPYQCHG